METKNTVLTQNNTVELTGEFVSEGKFSHELYGEKFYMYYLHVKRLSGSYDIVPLIISERLIDLNKVPIDTKVRITGQFRSHNLHDKEEGKTKLILSVFVLTLDLEDESEEECRYDDINGIVLDGYVCKEPIFRKTPLGREICDLLVAVNRAYGKSDYIPCICWGRSARFANSLAVGDKIVVEGRIQSRTYVKKIDNDSENTVERVAYEVSANKIYYSTESEQGEN